MREREKTFLKCICHVFQEFYGKIGGGNRRPEKKTMNQPNNKAKGKGRGKGKAPEEPGECLLFCHHSHCAPVVKFVKMSRSKNQSIE